MEYINKIFGTEEEANDFVEHYLAMYPYWGYGTRLYVSPAGWEQWSVKGQRGRSCD